MHRFKLVGFFGALVAALTLAGVSFARPPFESGGSDRDPGAFIEENAEALGLDDETLGAIRSIVEESRGKGDQLHAKQRELHEGMKTILSQDSPDDAAVMQQVEEIGAIEIEMHKHRLDTMLKIRALLTPEQREEMTRIREESRGRWKRALLEDCEADLEALCPDADERWSRKDCLKENRDKVSAECRDAMRAARHARHGSHEGCSGKCGAGCSMHEEGSGNCGAGCPKHPGGCPMHPGGCPMHRGQGCAENSGAGCSASQQPESLKLDEL